MCQLSFIAHHERNLINRPLNRSAFADCKQRRMHNKKKSLRFSLLSIGSMFLCGWSTLNQILFNKRICVCFNSAIGVHRVDQREKKMNRATRTPTPVDALIRHRQQKKYSFVPVLFFYHPRGRRAITHQYYRCKTEGERESDDGSNKYLFSADSSSSNIQMNKVQAMMMCHRYNCTQSLAQCDNHARNLIMPILFAERGPNVLGK